MSAQAFHSIKAVRRLFFPSRSEGWIKATFRKAEYGPVLLDGGGWLVSEQAVAEYQRRHAVAPAQDAPVRGRAANLLSFHD